MKIYVDLLFIINFFTDFLLLWMVAWVQRRKVKLWRLTAGALLGALTSLFLLFPFLSFLFTWVGKLCLSALILLVSFGYSGRPRDFFTSLLLFYFVGFLFGGGVFGLSFLMQSRDTVMKGVLSEEDVYLYPQATWVTLVIGYGLMFFLSKFFYSVVAFHKRRAKNLLQVRLFILEKEIEMTGLYDTGNQLYEPITRIPIVIMEVKPLLPLLPPEIVEWVKEGERNGYDLNRISMLPEAWQNIIRFAPYRVVGKEDQLLLTLVPHRIEVRDEDRVYTISRVRVGLTHTSLSGDHTYQAILHPDLLKEEYIQKETKEDSHVQSFTP